MFIITNFAFGTCDQLLPERFCSACVYIKISLRIFIFLLQYVMRAYISSLNLKDLKL